MTFEEMPHAWRQHAERTRQKTEARAGVCEIAAREFGAIPHTPDEFVPPSNSDWNECGAEILPMARTAYILVHQDKAEVVRMMDALGEEGSVDLFGCMANAAKFFESMLEIFNAGLARATIAMATLDVRDEVTA